MGYGPEKNQEIKKGTTEKITSLISSCSGKESARRSFPYLERMLRDWTLEKGKKSCDRSAGFWGGYLNTRFLTGTLPEPYFNILTAELSIRAVTHNT